MIQFNPPFHSLSVRGLFALLLALIAATEAVILWLLPAAPPGYGIAWIFLDAGLLALVCAPILWVLVVRPLQGAVLQGKLMAAEIMDAATDHGRVQANLDRDIAGHNLALKEIHAAEEKFRALVEQSLAGIYIFQDDVFRYANPKFLEIFGGSMADITSPSFIAWAVVEEDLAMVRENIRKRLAGEVESVRYNIRARKMDGTPISIEAHGTVAEYEGRPAIIGVMLDVTERRQMEEALRESEERYRELFNSGNDAILVHPILPGGVPGCFTEVNDLACRRLDYTREELLHLSPADIDDPASIDEDPTKFIHRVAAAGHALFERVHVAKDGRKIPVEINTHLFDLKGQTVALSIARDITERKLAEAALRESEARMREITSELGDGIYVLGQDGGLTFMNKAAEQMLGWSEAELLGKNAHEAFHYQKPDGTRVTVCDCPVYQAMHSGETYRIQEDYFTRKDGTMFPVSFVAAPLHRGGKVAGSVAAFQDITERRQAEERIRYMAHHDMLTGLPNRAMLTDRLNQALARAKRRSRQLAVMFLDLDRFKLINDTLGHDVGDELLKAVAQRLGESFREEDTVARIGGDEFVVLLNEITCGEDAALVASKLIKAVTSPVETGGHTLLVTTSIGIALYPTDGTDAVALLKNADIAMYQAKEGGRNGHRFFSAAGTDHENTPDPS